MLRLISTLWGELMPVIKAFIYFIVFKAAFQFLFGEPMTIVAAALASVAVTLIEIGSAGIMAPAVGAYMVKARYQGATKMTLVNATLFPFLICFALSLSAVLAITYAFTDELGYRLFHPRGYRASVLGSLIKAGIVVFILNLANYAMLVWAVDKQATGGIPTSES